LHKRLFTPENAKKIVTRINEGEEVCVTLVQLSEIANLLESYLPLKDAFKVEEFLLLAKNVKIFNVTKKDCLKALNIAKEEGVGLNDAIAYVTMTNNEVKGIYSFDKDFDKLKGIKRLSDQKPD
jgi:predicted nucleic acid-binding protein